MGKEAREEQTMPPVIDLKKCKKCGTCDLHCPLDVIHFDKKKKLPWSSIRRSAGTAAPAVLDCPVEAITIRFGPEMLCL